MGKGEATLLCRQWQRQTYDRQRMQKSRIQNPRLFMLRGQRGRLIPWGDWVLQSAHPHRTPWRAVELLWDGLYALFVGGTRRNDLLWEEESHLIFMQSIHHGNLEKQSEGKDAVCARDSRGRRNKGTWMGLDLMPSSKTQLMY